MMRLRFSILIYCGMVNVLIAGNVADSIQQPVIQPKITSPTDQFTAVIFGFDYFNNATTDSRLNNIVNQASYAPYISFYSKIGLFVNGGLNYIANSDSSLSKSTYSIDLTMGYDIKIGKMIVVTPMYSHSFFSQKTMLLNKIYSDCIDLSTSCAIGNWNSILSASYKWGKIEDWNFSMQSSYTFSIGKIFAKEDLIMVQPGISINFNNPNYYSKLFSFLDAYINAHPNAGLARLAYDIYHINDQSEELVKLRRKLLANKDLAYMIRDYLPTGMPLSEILGSNNSMAITNFTVSLPVSYLIGDFTINASFSAYRTINQPIYLQNKWYTNFSAGVSYAINW